MGTEDEYSSKESWEVVHNIIFKGESESFLFWSKRKRVTLGLVVVGRCGKEL